MTQMHEHASVLPVVRTCGSSEEAQELQPVAGSSDKEASWRRWLVEMIVLNLVMIMWNTDNMVLPAVYTEIARHFNASPGRPGLFGPSTGNLRVGLCLSLGILG